MKKITCLLMSLFFWVSILTALMNMPEGISYFAELNSCFVSCWGSSSVVMIDNTGDEMEILSGLHHCANNLLVGNMLYITYGNHLKAIDITILEEQFDIILNGAIDADGLAMADDGYLYVVTHNNKVYKVDVEEETVVLFVNGGIGTYSQDMIYDAEYNRLLICSYQQNSPLYAVDLTTGDVSVPMETGLNNLDGLAVDENGDIYIASWGSGSIYRINNEFTDGFEELITGLNGPSGIELNLSDNLIYVAGFYSGLVTTYPLPETDSDSQNILPSSVEMINYPNPFNPNTTIELKLGSTQENDLIELSIFNAKGQQIKSLNFAERDNDGNFTVIWNGTNSDNHPVPSGIYLYKLQTGNRQVVRKMIMMK